MVPFSKNTRNKIPPTKLITTVSVVAIFIICCKINCPPVSTINENIKIRDEDINKFVCSFFFLPEANFFFLTPSDDYFSHGLPDKNYLHEAITVFESCEELIRKVSLPKAAVYLDIYQIVVNENDIILTPIKSDKIGEFSLTCSECKKMFNVSHEDWNETNEYEELDYAGIICPECKNKPHSNKYEITFSF